MNELAVRWLWLMGQVTLISLIAGWLCAVSARRSPGAGTAVALAGFIGVIALTMLAVLPMPAWWSWADWLYSDTTAHTTSSENAESSGSSFSNEVNVQDGLPDTASGGWSLRSLKQLLDQLGPTIHGVTQRNSSWGTWVGILLLAGIGFSVARLLIGLCAVRKWTANSRLIDDASLRALAANLCTEMACRRRIDVREAVDVGGPVTVGWRNPSVLLPMEWRSWSAEELRAVLAHEIAHVCRADYAAWLLARLCVACHFYHPLVHLLASRLHLQQELAADALGACHAGGSRAYLRALARLALRQEEIVRSGPARAFLPARGTLMRRIAMLRMEQRIHGRCWRQSLAVLLLGVVVLGVSTLRGPAQSEDKIPTNPAPQTPDKQAEAKRPPFEYCVYTPDADGFFAFRPSVFFSTDPKLKKYADDIDKGIAEIVQALGLTVALPKVADIDQVSGCIFFKFNENAPKGQRNMLMGSLVVLRTTGAFDWMKIVNSLANKVTEVSFEGRTYFEIQAEDFKYPQLFPVMGGTKPSLFFFQPDDRTLALGSEEQFRDMIRNGPSAKPEWAKAAGWEHVESSIFAAAITNKDQRFSNLWMKSPPEEVPAEINEAIKKTTTIVFGIDHDGELRADLLAACANEEEAMVVFKAVSQGIARIREPQLTTSVLREFLRQTTRLAIANWHSGNKKDMVHTTAHTNLSLADLLEFLTKAEVKAVEVKDK